MPEPPADLTVSQVKGLIDQLPRLDRVVLHGIGESLLNPELGEILALVTARGASTVLNANGTVMDRKRALALIDGGLDSLRISIDAASPETYEAIRGADSFEKIRRHIALITELKQQRGVTHPEISLWMMGLETSLRELPQLVRLAADAGVEEVYLQRLVTSERGIALRRHSLFGAAVQNLDPIAEAESVARALGVRLLGSGNTTGRQSVSVHDEDAPWRGCYRPWALMYITANGNALPCCIAPFTVTPHRELILGNVFESSISEVWRGERYTAWRQAMLRGAPPTPCAGCGVTWSL
jgi:MoaA/NifB/PqqE/SkfB family radical SAM enzyme